ncbi:GntR family transcriptional regulator [Microbacterium oxydans]|uniref:GntR family transcriptional regulator n=1 Tax=Microbacterium oxydans TaxID=82380 RepID=UPI00226B47CD|nr:GntR family transcriptional regulator [Microbacterium oxydans]WAA65642.1 GntR family transcriptional regulator [Microbacterium oxydans]
MSNRAIDKNVLGDSIFVRVLGDIIAMRYQPGQRLNVDSIAEEFGVSRTPVREALLRLAATRFVEVVRNSRTQIAEWDADDIRDRLEVTGRLVRLVLVDPRLDVAALSAPMARVAPGSNCCADVQLFLDLASAIVESGVNRVAGYVLLELITPIRIFFQPEVLRAHGLDVSSSDDERHTLIDAAIDAAHRGDAAIADQHLGRYISALAGVTSPRNGVSAYPTPNTTAVEAAGLALRAVQ